MVFFAIVWGVHEYTCFLDKMKSVCISANSMLCTFNILTTLMASSKVLNKTVLQKVKEHALYLKNMNILLYVKCDNDS